MFIQFTTTKNEVIIINTSNIIYIQPYQEGCKITTLSYGSFRIKNSIEEITPHLPNFIKLK